MPPIDPVFADPRVAGLYGLFNPCMGCDDFYLSRAADAVALLRSAGRHLAPGGRLVLETCNPALRAAA